MAYNFNNSLVPGPTDQAPEEPNAPAASGSPVPAPVSPIPLTPVTSDNRESAAGVRFRSCRWMQPPDNGNQAFCTHREVKPYAGMQGFDAEAWCPECAYYKLRRAPRKRNDETFTY